MSEFVKSLLQCYGFHSEANEMAIADIKAIANNS